MKTFGAFNSQAIWAFRISTHYLNYLKASNIVRQHDILSNVNTKIGQNLPKINLLSDLELQNADKMTQFYDTKIQTLEKKAAEEERKKGRNNPLVKNIKSQIARWKQEQRNLPQQFGGHKRHKRHYSTDSVPYDIESRKIVEDTINVKLELNTNQKPLCPKIPLKNRHKRTILDPGTHWATVGLEDPNSPAYELDWFLFGDHNLHPHPTDCG